MDMQTPDSSDSSSIEVKTIFGFVTIVLGVLSLIVSRSTVWGKAGWEFGWILIAIGTPLVLWWLFKNFSNNKVIGVILLMRHEKLLEIIKDKDRSKKLITKSILEWAQRKDESTIKIKGVTLNLVFGNNGIFTELIEGKKLINRDAKKMQVLLLNPYSMNAITRSIQESRPFRVNFDPVHDISKHTLDEHKKNVLYEDFECAVENIRDLISDARKYKITIECNIYSNDSPGFLLIDGQRAISENLIMGKKKKDTEGKLYGILPHIIYGNGEIKESLDSHFDYLWKYDSIPLEDFHEKVEEKYYEINRLFLLYNIQKEIWETEWGHKGAGRSLLSEYDKLYQGYKEFYIGFSPKRILDLGCGDGGGGSLTILKENPNARINFIDISHNAIGLFIANIKLNQLDSSNAVFEACDMLTFLNRCEPLYYSLVHANFSIIYMTKIKAVEIYSKIFNALQNGGVFMLSVWTHNYFKMPVGHHGEEGKRPPHMFVRIPMTEDLQVLSGGSEYREGEIRRFYRGIEELMEEFQSADGDKTMDFEKIHYRYYENDAILRVWVKKK